MVQNRTGTKWGKKTTGEVVVICPTSDRKVPHFQKLVVPILMQIEMNVFFHRSGIATGTLTTKKCGVQVAVIPYFLKFANNFEEQGRHHFF